MKKLIVIDDDRDILEALQITLEDAGYNVNTSTQGDYLDNLVDGNVPDAIILDVLLSGKDGREIAKKLRTRNPTKNIPIIMISAHPSAEKSVKACGANDFLAKPFNIRELLNLVEKYTKSN